MKTALILIKNVFELLKSLIDLISKCAVSQRKKHNNDSSEMNDSAQKVNVKEAETTRKPWLIIRDDQIVVYRNTGE